MAFDYILYLTTYCINATRFASSLMRGVFRRRSCKAERGVASCGGGSNRSPREGRDLVQIRRQCRRRNVRRAAAGAFAACPPKLRRRQGPGRQTPRWSAERRACVSRKRNVRAAPHPRGSLAPKGATKTRRCASRRSAHPSIRWVKVKLTRARPRAGTRRRGLFDIVRCDYTATVRRRAANSVAKRRQRRIWPNEVATWVKARIVGPRPPFVCVAGSREEPTCGCGKRSPAPLHCFRIVIYNERRNSNVSSRKRAVATIAVPRAAGAASC
jgi:hypothetical protein